MTRVLYIPEQVDEEFSRLVALPEERQGVLIYPKHPRDLHVEALFLTGHGTADRVGCDLARLVIANRFLERNPNYGYATFHTHTQASVERNADSAHKFSTKDWEELFRCLGRDRQYISVLVTPETIIARGMKPVHVQHIVRPCYDEHSQAIYRKLEAAAVDISMPVEAVHTPPRTPEEITMDVLRVIMCDDSP